MHALVSGTTKSNYDMSASLFMRGLEKMYLFKVSLTFKVKKKKMIVMST